MLFSLHSLKGVSSFIRTMIANPRNALLVSGGITAFVASGYVIEQLPKVYIERLKLHIEDERLEQEQEKTKQLDLQLQVVKVKR
jgi:hypothetical protein